MILIKTFFSQDLGWFDKPKNNVGALITGLAVDAAQVQGVRLDGHKNN